VLKIVYYFTRLIIVSYCCISLAGILCLKFYSTERDIYIVNNLIS